MPDTRRLEHAKNFSESSLRTLVRTITYAQGEYVIILGYCNYPELRECLINRLSELSSIAIHSIFLPESTKELYASIKAELGDEQPQALMVFGIESVHCLDLLLISTNQVREEFRNNFSFPLVLWVNDTILRKLIKLAPDFENWSTTIQLAIATEELLHQPQLRNSQKS